MTHWRKIDRTTREFTDSSYKKLHTPSEYFWTPEQKAEMEAKRKKKEADERRKVRESNRRES